MYLNLGCILFRVPFKIKTISDVTYSYANMVLVKSSSVYTDVAQKRMKMQEKPSEIHRLRSKRSTRHENA
jgi:hypothetical protein